MDKTVAGLIGAVTLLAAADPALAAMPAPTGLKAAMQAESYADLLKPIPDAVTLLKESDEAAAKADLAKAELLPAASEGRRRSRRPSTIITTTITIITGSIAGSTTTITTITGSSAGITTTITTATSAPTATEQPPTHQPRAEGDAPSAFPQRGPFAAPRMRR
ncbi:hypothetical protein ACFQFG_20280 [Methylobacterium persicinum]